MGKVVKTVMNPVHSIFGTDDQAKYSELAAMDAQRSRAAVTAEARAARTRMNLAAQSPQQLAALERSYAAAQTQVDTDLRQLAAIDPAIMEASQQVLKLLKGDNAAVNAPIMQQRQQQRQQLIDSLKAQYGPGAESSSIGQRALRAFDMESNTAFQQNQMGTLGNLFGMATTRVQNQGFGQLMNTAQGFGDYQSRILGAESAGSQGILGAMGGEVASAGAQYTGELMRAGAQRQLVGQAINTGVAAYTGGISGGSKGSSKPTGGMTNSGSTGGFSLSNPGTTDSNFWDKNPYG